MYVRELEAHLEEFAHVRVKGMNASISKTVDYHEKDDRSSQQSEPTFLLLFLLRFLFLLIAASLQLSFLLLDFVM